MSGDFDLETLWRIIDEGSTPAIAAIAYFIWRLDKSLSLFIGEIKALAKVRDQKLDDIAENVDGVIKRLAGIENAK